MRKLFAIAMSVVLLSIVCFSPAAAIGCTWDDAKQEEICSGFGAAGTETPTGDTISIQFSDLAAIAHLYGWVLGWEEKGKDGHSDIFFVQPGNTTGDLPSWHADQTFPGEGKSNTSDGILTISALDLKKALNWLNDNDQSVPADLWGLWSPCLNGEQTRSNALGVIQRQACPISTTQAK